MADEPGDVKRQFRIRLGESFRSSKINSPPGFIFTSFNFLPKQVLESSKPGSVRVEQGVDEERDCQLLTISREKTEQAGGAAKKPHRFQGKLALDSCFDCVFIWDSDAECYVLERASNVLFDSLIEHSTALAASAAPQRQADSAAATPSQPPRPIQRLPVSVPVAASRPTRPAALLPTATFSLPTPLSIPRHAADTSSSRRLELSRAQQQQQQQQAIISRPTALSGLTGAVLRTTGNDDEVSASSSSESELPSSDDDDDDDFDPSLLQTPARRPEPDAPFS